VKRRGLLAAGLGLPFCGWAAGVQYPRASTGAPLRFPRDHGAHPDFRTEWWYATGWLQTARGEALGFQVTFFRARPPFEATNPSSFAPRQVLVAHAALADPKLGRLRHDQRAAREALGLAGAGEETTTVWIDDWKMALEGNVYRSRVLGRGFLLELEFVAGRPPLAQGEGGVSRKGWRSEEASFYYSRPQLAVRGSIERGAGSEAVSGTAWLDHEWASSMMAPEAAGWDWVGLNLADGGALMAFRMRDRTGSAHYSGGTLLLADGTERRFGPREIVFAPLRRWRSPRTGVEYPVAMRVTAGAMQWELAPLMDDQELDARTSTGTIYWEGAVRALQRSAEAGRGYLELTGYWKPMKL